jgi:hypothetical protein
MAWHPVGSARGPIEEGMRMAVRLHFGWDAGGSKRHARRAQVGRWMGSQVWAARVSLTRLSIAMSSGITREKSLPIALRVERASMIPRARGRRDDCSHLRPCKVESDEGIPRLCKTRNLRSSSHAEVAFADSDHVRQARGDGAGGSRLF